MYNIPLGDDEKYDAKFYSKKEDPSTQDILQIVFRWAQISGDQNVFNEIKNSETQTKTLLINKEEL